MLKFWLEQAERYAEITRHAFTINQILYPYLVQTSAAHRAILDYGCGDGTLGSLFDAAKDITLFDQSPSFIKIAQQKLKAEDRKITFTSDPRTLTPGKYDFISLCFVLMSIKSSVKIKEILKTLKNLKSPDGEVVISLTHPCFRAYPYSYFKTDYNHKNFEYNKEGAPFLVSIYDGVKTLSLQNYHRSLEYTINTILDTGFQLSKIKEIYDRSASSPDISNVPPYLVIHCK